MALFVGVGFLIGLAAGSFLNVCIRRLPLRQSVVRPGSHCPHCSAPIRWRDKIPLLSFFLLARRCRACKQTIPWRYPLVEVLTALLFGLIATGSDGLAAARDALFVSMMIVLIFTDLEQRVLPDSVTMPGIVVGVAFSRFIPLDSGPVGTVASFRSIELAPWVDSIGESVVAAAMFGALLWGIREVYYRLRGMEGLGLGDVKLMAMIGAFEGIPSTALVLVLGTCAAAVWGIAYIRINDGDWTYPIPLGSFLAGAALVSLFASDKILNLYWGLVLG